MMKPYSTTCIGLARVSRQWTCSNCCHNAIGPGSSLVRSVSRMSAASAPKRNHPEHTLQQSSHASSSRQGNSNHGGAKDKHHGREKGGGPNTNRTLLLSSSGAAVGTGAMLLAFSDDIKQSYEAAERAGRVLAALAICVNDYRTSINQRDKTTDDEQRERIIKDCHIRCAERTYRVMEQNGGIFIKLGQHISAMNYLLPPEWTNTFIPLQDRCPVSSLEAIEKMFKDDTGQALSDYFSDFSPVPIGAASLAQVHLATIKETGRRVAVKVQHPGLAQWAPLDLALTRYTFATLKWIFPEYDLEWLSSEMDVSLPIELDFREEANNARRTKAYFAKIPSLPLVIPDVIWARQRILVMAYEAGRRPDDLEFLDSNGIDRDDVAAALAHIFNSMIFGRDAPLHCDPHGGNIAVRKNPARKSATGAGFDVILYDHGLYRDIPVELRRSYAKLWLAIIDGDFDRMRVFASQVAGITEDEFPLFASAITGRDFTAVVRNHNDATAEKQASAATTTTSTTTPLTQGDKNVPIGDKASTTTTAPDTNSPTQPSVLQPRDDNEREAMSGALQAGLLVDLVGLLGRVPRVILLILKTNDLTRSLNESLQTREGPIRSFLILARYCARTVLDEQLEEIWTDRPETSTAPTDTLSPSPTALLPASSEDSSEPLPVHPSLPPTLARAVAWPGRAFRSLAVWLSYIRIEAKLELFEFWLGMRRRLAALGLRSAQSPLTHSILMG